MRKYIAWAVMLMCVGVAFATSTLGWWRFGALAVLAVFVWQMWLRGGLKDDVKEEVEKAKEDFENIKEKVEDVKEDIVDAVEGAKEHIEESVEDTKEFFKSKINRTKNRGLFK